MLIRERGGICSLHEGDRFKRVILGLGQDWADCESGLRCTTHICWSQQMWGTGDGRLFFLVEF